MDPRDGILPWLQKVWRIFVVRFDPNPFRVFPTSHYQNWQFQTSCLLDFLAPREWAQNHSATSHLPTPDCELESRVICPWTWTHLPHSNTGVIGSCLYFKCCYFVHHGFFYIDFYFLRYLDCWVFATRINFVPSWVSCSPYPAPGPEKIALNPLQQEWGLLARVSRDFHWGLIGQNCITWPPSLGKQYSAFLCSVMGAGKEERGLGLSS